MKTGQGGMMIDDCSHNTFMMNDDDDLYIIGAVCPSVTKVIIPATVAGEIYI